MAYNRATQGTLSVNLLGYGVVQMYAPTTWANEVSLNYFVPDSTKKITELLSHDFGKGYAIRDISHDYSSLFRNSLGWNVMITTGESGNNNTDNSFSTDSTVAYKGEIFIREKPNIEYGLPRATTFSTQDEVHPKEDYVDWEELFMKYDCSLGMSGRLLSYGWAVALLKKDGSWDIVKDYSYTPFTISTKEFELHCDVSEYARTCDGFLRGRITFTDGITSDATYYVLDYLPQKVEMDFIGVVPSTYSTRAITDDEYMKDIKIGIKNIEGADRVVVEQHDEWDRVPFRYELSNFRDGYFIATVDKEFYSEFRVIAYNKNGSTVSETFTVEPLEPVELTIETEISDNYITVRSNQNRHQAVGGLIESYGINTLDVYNVQSVPENATSIEGNRIDISSLATGLYLLNVTDCYGNRHAVKFMKY